MFPVSPWRRRAATALALGLLPAAAAVPAHAAPVAEGVVVGAGAGGAVPGRYIVTLRGGTLGASARGLVAGRITRAYGSLPAFTATLSASQARRLAGDPSVAVVEQDRLVRVAGVTAASVRRGPVWGLDRIDQRSRSLSRTYTASADGSAVHAYVIDTGIRTTHRQFGGRASSGYDFADGDRNAADCAGHGTHVAAAIGGSTYGVAKKVRLVAVRVLDCSGAGYLSTIIDGVDWVTRHAVKPAVANMSLGSDYSPALDRAVQKSIDSGVTYAVAAGNENDDAYYHSPADVQAAITVGASDARDRRAGFSNWGSSVDLFAPGVAVMSAWKGTDTATATLSGTSMATPYVAGAAALVLDAHPSMRPAQVSAYLTGRATTGKIVDRGPGSPNRLLHVPPPPARAVIATTSLPAASAGTAYNAQLTLTGARRGSWRVAAGTLPAGLSLSTGGRISGTPATAGDSRVTIRFTDHVPQSVNRAYVLTVH